MATSLRLVVLLCAFAASAVFAQDLKPDFLDDNLELTHNVEKRATNKDQTIIFGAEGSNDRLIFRENVRVSKGFLQVRKKDITFPEKAGQNDPTITCIKILDNLKNGKNAAVKLTSGGLWKKFAIINMKSQRGEPIKYDVLIYGR